jgi:ATP-binding cassette subfamily C (CFTR/MRP) protein 1
MANTSLLIVAIILLAIYVSYYVVITVGILFITFPLAALMGRRFGYYRGQVQAQGDKRLKLTNELLQGIRIVKYYAWERAFQANIESFRDKELEHVKALSMNRSALIFLMQNATVLALGLTLVR